MIELTRENIVALLADAGLLGLLTSVDWDDGDYQAAKEQWIYENHDEPCWEDVAAQLLLNGGSIRLEYDNRPKWHELTYAQLCNGYEKYLRHRKLPSDQVLEDIEFMDSIEADMIVQFGVFGEYRYG